MLSRSRKIVQAWLETPTTGTIELARDWRAREKPDLQLSGGQAFAGLERVDDYAHARQYCYFFGARGVIHFVFFLSQYPDFDPYMEHAYVAGDFNGWKQAVGKSAWELYPASIDGELAMVWSGPPEALGSSGGQRFKFVTDEARWFPVPYTAPNAVRDSEGNTNYFIDPERTGHHLFQFTLFAPLDLSVQWTVEWGKGSGEGAPLRPGGYFHELLSDLALGAVPHSDETVFRLFAPRASKVELCLVSSTDPKAAPFRYPLQRRSEPVERMREALTSVPFESSDHSRAPFGIPSNWQGVWEVVLDQDLHGWYYWYHIDGPQGPFSRFDFKQKVLDPYALACATREGPGIVLSPTWVGHPPGEPFLTPGWQDLVIAEAHVRDLTRNAPVTLTYDERSGFEGLRAWVESDAFYLQRLGVNCVELQPVQENDALTRGEYHWGYMPVNWFSPASQYSRDPAAASGVKEFQALVAAFHARGMAVILDVVYNHVGEPAHLMFADKHYYFETDGTGTLSNWSGCGNDYRARSAMAKRLIVDSCTHLIRAYGVDGFRFDLAELLGTPVLIEIERALKTLKRDLILIAEPWSFRGHIAGELAETGWSSWNDGYRELVRDYVRGKGTAVQLEYYLKGSPWYFARWPAQTVNYTESHDDRTWIDVITENSSGNGHHPTQNDERRSRLMAAILFASLGIPMLSAGQDFLRSKQGVNNTYLRGDLNAIDYRRAVRYPGTHGYFASWIAFRLSEQGRLLRLWSPPSEGYFRSFSLPGSNAIALLYNADGSQGPERLLFAVNPGMTEVELPLDEDSLAREWLHLADQERFGAEGVPGIRQPVERLLFLPALGCGLWISKG